jgi:hypothetical protein
VSTHLNTTSTGLAFASSRIYCTPKFNFHSNVQNPEWCRPRSSSLPARSRHDAGLAYNRRSCPDFEGWKRLTGYSLVNVVSGLDYRSVSGAIGPNDGE